jgi:lipoprotein-releasing system ATP-binding protein
VILEARDVCKDYRMGRSTLHVLREVSLRIQAGELVSIIGPSGAGKSTLLHILGILETPTSGTVEVEGRDVSRLGDTERSLQRNRRIGFVFQFYHLLPDFDALENVCLPALTRCGAFEWVRTRHELRERARHVLETVGLADRMRHRPAQLSGGERQRVAIARALINEPVVLLCDEPTGNLDTKTGRVIQDLLWRLNEENGQTVVFVTHDEHLAARAPRQMHMVDGRINAGGGSERAVDGPSG